MRPISLQIKPIAPAVPRVITPYFGEEDMPPPKPIEKGFEERLISDKRLTSEGQFQRDPILKQEARWLPAQTTLQVLSLGSLFGILLKAITALEPLSALAVAIIPTFPTTKWLFDRSSNVIAQASNERQQKSDRLRLPSITPQELDALSEPNPNRPLTLIYFTKEPNIVADALIHDLKESCGERLVKFVEYNLNQAEKPKKFALPPDTLKARSFPCLSLISPSGETLFSKTHLTQTRHQEIMPRIESQTLMLHMEQEQAERRKLQTTKTD